MKARKHDDDSAKQEPDLMKDVTDEQAEDVQRTVAGETDHQESD